MSGAGLLSHEWAGVVGGHRGLLSEAGGVAGRASGLLSIPL